MGELVGDGEEVGGGKGGKEGGRGWVASCSAFRVLLGGGVSFAFIAPWPPPESSPINELDLVTFQAVSLASL